MIQHHYGQSLDSSTALALRSNDLNSGGPVTSMEKSDESSNGVGITLAIISLATETYTGDLR